MAKLIHRKFNGERFVDKFAEHPQLLRTFARSFDATYFPDEETFELDAFKELAAEAAARNPDLLEHLCRAYDLSDPRGHEAICQVARDEGLDIDHSLPVECLAIWLHNTREDLFHFAYDRYAFNQVEKTTIYRIPPPDEVADNETALAEFENALKEAFQEDKGSSNVLVRQYEENDRVNIIIYHEKRTQAQLVFKGQADVVAPIMLRPAKQDFLSFKRDTGELQIDASFSKEKKVMRRAFAGSFLRDPELFENEEASRVLNLDVIAAADFELALDSPEHSARVTELHFSLPTEGNPSFTVRSPDVLSTLQEVGLVNQRAAVAQDYLTGARVTFAKLRIQFGPGKRDKKTIELRAQNSIGFNQSTYHEEVFDYLRKWGILLAAVPAQVLA